jgi:uncharacterized sulfatase
MRKTRWARIVFFAVVFCSCRFEKKNVSLSGSRPNILLILSDDQSVSDNSCYGNQNIRTPHIDALAARGMRFTRAFTSTAMCTPSRSQLYTGLYPQKNGAHGNHMPVKAGVKSLPHYLKPLGYAVALAGKVHVGPKGNFPFRHLSLEEGVVKQYLETCKKQRKPFCLIVALHEPHGPYSPPNALDVYQKDLKPPPWQFDTPRARRKRRAYANAIDSLDKKVGRLSALLKEIDLEEDTLVIYTSDHGNGVFAKYELYDAGLRVPFIASWPGRIAEGLSNEAMIQFVDVLPTFIELAGARPPEELDGRSFVKTFSGSRRHRLKVYGAHTNKGINYGGEYPKRSVRGPRYKLIVNFRPDNTFSSPFTGGGDGPRRGRSKAALFWKDIETLSKQDENMKARSFFYQHRPREELYDLTTDPFELHNLAGEPRYQKLLEDLKSDLLKWMLHQKDILY